VPTKANLPEWVSTLTVAGRPGQVPDRCHRRAGLGDHGPGTHLCHELLCHRNHTVLARKLQDYLRSRNAKARRPEVLPAQRRERPASAANAA
jgi:hypothetical protein